MRRLTWVTVWTALLASIAAAGETPPTCRIEAMPEGYHLQAYDDCGILDRQPHVRAAGVHTFNVADVKADERARSVAWHATQIDAVYEGLDPKVAYVVVVTYANEPYNNRVQSLWAGAVQLHGPHPLPKGKAERLLFRVPSEAIQDNRLALHFKLEAQVNAVVSAIELWSPAPAAKALHIAGVSGLYTDLEGRVLNLAYEGLPGVEVRLGRPGDTKPLATTQTDTSGRFRFERRIFERSGQTTELQLTVTHEGATAARAVPASDLFFQPVRYRPIPAEVGGLKDPQMSLDGVWRINLSASDEVRKAPLDAKGWGNLNVPGQWVQQGYDVPQDKAVAMAKEFEIPAAWKGYRLILRFDAIHAGTRYWLNGKPISPPLDKGGRGEVEVEAAPAAASAAHDTSASYSENLFTPVEWDITDAARVGGHNRLDLEMKVDTVSEKLSYASGYAFHNLGGIDRSVRIFALPPVYVRSLHVTADLDAEYRDADLKLDVGMESAAAVANGLTLNVRLFGPDGKPAEHSVPTVEIGSLADRSKTVAAVSRVKEPSKWNAEQPNLYRLVLELKQGDRLLERIERNIGFRKVEIRDRQLYVNGKPIKLAGACHHETYPLTGRADTGRYAEQDVKLLKSANLNYIRTSHYPPTQELLDAADRLGMYVECEAPFCWVNGGWDMTCCREVLTPTSAMIDYCHTHPSIIYWSLANESNFCEFFEVSNRLVKDLDPTRPTTFNNPDPKKVCDIGNMHYPLMPYADHVKNDPRPFVLGEYFYPVCHEQTDVRINPGLRELWGAGHSDPDSEFGKACATSYDKPIMVPGGRPGAWSYMVHSDSLIGGAIWAAIDEPYYLPNGKKVGYAWVHGFWGLIDGWRRPKPELWFAKFIFSPVWFPVRQVAFTPGQETITIPVENRYSFTNLKDLAITWEAGGKRGTIKADVPPASMGKLEIPVPADAKPSDGVTLRLVDARGDLVNTLIVRLGGRVPQPLPEPNAGPPEWHDDGKTIVIEGDGFALVVDKTAGELKPADPRHKSPVARFPSVHVTRYDYGDLGPPGALPYGVLPDEKTRAVESVTAVERNGALELTVKDRYDGFAGSVMWRIDRKGVGRISCDYAYSGVDLSTREVGMKLLLEPACDEVRWRRWSEWDIFPEEHISRTEGVAKARRDKKWGPTDAPESMTPTWPWSLDQTELGTNDFRAIKFNIYEASLVAPTGAGIRVRANADVHVRPCLADDGVRLHVLSQCRMGAVPLKKGDRVAGTCIVELLGR